MDAVQLAQRLVDEAKKRKTTGEGVKIMTARWVCIVEVAEGVFEVVTMPESVDSKKKADATMAARVVDGNLTFPAGTGRLPVSLPDQCTSYVMSLRGTSVIRTRTARVTEVVAAQEDDASEGSDEARNGRPS
jgi:hypothetical protein